MGIERLSKNLLINHYRSGRQGVLLLRSVNGIGIFTGVFRIVFGIFFRNCLYIKGAIQLYARTGRIGRNEKTVLFKTDTCLFGSCFIFKNEKTALHLAYLLYRTLGCYRTVVKFI